MSEILVDAYEINTKAWLVKCVFTMVANIMELSVSGRYLLFVTCPAVYLTLFITFNFRWVYGRWDEGLVEAQALESP